MPPFLLELAIRPRAEWSELVSAFVASEAARVSGKGLDPALPLWDQGIDSLLAIELRNALSRAGLRLPLARMIAGPSIEEITRIALAELAADPRLQAAPVAVDEAPTELAPLTPVASHLLAAVGGALLAAAVLFLVWRLLG